MLLDHNARAKLNAGCCNIDQAGDSLRIFDELAKSQPALKRLGYRLLDPETLERDFPRPSTLGRHCGPSGPFFTKAGARKFRIVPMRELQLKAEADRTAQERENREAREAVDRAERTARQAMEEQQRELERRQKERAAFKAG